MFFRKRRTKEILSKLSHPMPLRDMPLRISLCIEALGNISQTENPETWAALQDDLGNNYAENPIGDRGESLEKAILHFENALQVRTKEKFPVEWGQTQNNLASTYQIRIYGQHAENIEKAIYHFQQALEVCSRNTESDIWASIQNNLGDTYRTRIKGVHAENIERAIHHLQQALEVMTRQSFPDDWAEIQHNLSVAYADRIYGEPSTNIERAIEYSLQALSVKKQYSESWAATQSILGRLYRVRGRGERAVNMKQAIFHCRQALKVYTRQTFLYDWINTQDALALAYSHRIQGRQAENIEEAVSLYLQVLEVVTIQADPDLWATIQNNLASVHEKHHHSIGGENIEKAIFHYQQALRVYTQETDAERWATIQNNLGNAYSQRIYGDRNRNFEKSIQFYKQNLKIKTRTTSPNEWAMTQNNLAVAYADWASLLSGKRQKESVEQAIYHYQLALEIRTIESSPREYRQTMRSLGDLAFAKKRWELARDSYEAVLLAQSILLQTSFTYEGKKRELHETKNLFSKIAYTYVQLGYEKRAVEILEQGRAQQIRSSMRLKNRSVAQLSTLGFDNLRQLYHQAWKKYNDLLNQYLDTDLSTGSSFEQVRAASKQLQSVIKAIQNEVGEKYPKYRYFLEKLPYSEIQNQAKNKLLVYLTATSVGGMALVVSDQGIQPISLPNLNNDTLYMQVYGRKASSKIGGYLGAYMRWRDNPASMETHLAWLNTLDRTTQWLWNAGVGDLVLKLKEQKKEVILIPMGLLTLLPIHATWTEDLSLPTKRRYALDDLNISYAPSAHALWLTSVSNKSPIESILAVENPDESLAFSSKEVQAILAGFRYIKHLSGRKVKVGVVKDEMQKANILHFATHAIAGWLEAEQPYLSLKDGNLTLSDILELDLTQTRLAVLSACETSVPDLELIDEIIGLPSGMMQAGAQGVIGTLWSVNDMSTAILMARFYKLWRIEGVQPQEALRQSQIWLRDSTTAQKKRFFKHLMEDTRANKDVMKAFYNQIGWDNPDGRTFASPFYWAAFSYTGI